MEEEKVIDVDKNITLPLPPAATRRRRSFLHDREKPPSRLKLHLALIFAQAGLAGYQVLIRRSLGHGTSILVFCFYKNCLGFILLRFFSGCLEKKNKPVLNFPALLATFLLGFFGLSVSELCFLHGLKYTTPTMASSMQNLIPVFTFILALIFRYVSNELELELVVLSGFPPRMEKVEVDRIHGIAKLLGSIMLIAGWMLLLIYKGETLYKSHFTFLSQNETAMFQEHHHHHLIRIGSLHLNLDHQQYGIVFIVISCISSSIFLILQAFIMEKYVGPISFASFAFFFSIIQVGVVAAVRVHHRSSWTRLSIFDGINLGYAGIIASTAFGLQSWGVKQAGPMMVAAYQPLETVATIFLAFFLLKENLNMGSVIGALIILFGLYFMIWGKEREQRFEALYVVRDFHGMSSVANTELPSDFSFGVITDGLASSATTKSITEPVSMEQSVDEPPWYSKIRAPKTNGEAKLCVEKNSSWVFTQPLFADDDNTPANHPEPEHPAIVADDVGGNRRSPSPFSRNQSLRERTPPISRNQSLRDGIPSPSPFSRNQSLRDGAPSPSPFSRNRSLRDRTPSPFSTFSRNQSLRERTLVAPPSVISLEEFQMNEGSGIGGVTVYESDDQSSDTSIEMASTRSNFSRWNSGRTAASVRSVPSRMSNFSNLSSLGPSRANSIRSAASRLTPTQSTISDSSSDSDQIRSSMNSNCSLTNV